MGHVDQLVKTKLARRDRVKAEASSRGDIRRHHPGELPSVSSNPRCGQVDWRRIDARTIPLPSRHRTGVTSVPPTHDCARGAQDDRDRDYSLVGRPDRSDNHARRTVEALQPTRRRPDGAGSSSRSIKNRTRGRNSRQGGARSCTRVRRLPQCAEGGNGENTQMFHRIVSAPASAIPELLDAGRYSR